MVNFIFIVFLISSQFYVQATEYKVTHQVGFDMVVGNKEVGTIVIGLFGDIAPKTVKNFIALSTTGVQGKTYAGSPIHRIIDKFMIQGGDIINHDGTGSISIYGKKFDDEEFLAEHSSPGMVSMANSGPNSNGCQFFITTVATPWLDHKHVVFGKVVQGQNIVHFIEHLKRDSSDRPIQPVFIKRCGLVHTPRPFWVSDVPYNIWEWIRGITIPLSFSTVILLFFHWIYRKLNAVEKSIEKLE